MAEPPPPEDQNLILGKTLLPPSPYLLRSPSPQPVSLPSPTPQERPRCRRQHQLCGQTRRRTPPPFPRWHHNQARGRGAPPPFSRRRHGTPEVSGAGTSCAARHAAPPLVRAAAATGATVATGLLSSLAILSIYDSTVPVEVPNAGGKHPQSRYISDSMSVLLLHHRCSMICLFGVALRCSLLGFVMLCSTRCCFCAT